MVRHREQNPGSAAWARDQRQLRLQPEDQLSAHVILPHSGFIVSACDSDMQVSTCMSRCVGEVGLYERSRGIVWAIERPLNLRLTLRNPPHFLDASQGSISSSITAIVICPNYMYYLFPLILEFFDATLRAILAFLRFPALYLPLASGPLPPNTRSIYAQSIHLAHHSSSTSAIT